MTTFSFSNSVALVVGANGGVGSVIAKLFLESGAKTAFFVHQSRDVVDALISSHPSYRSRAHVVSVDITDRDSVQEGVKEVLTIFHSIDFLVNCAGIYVDGDEWNKDEGAWKKTLEVNLLGAMQVSKEVGKHFVEKKKGVIVNIASRFSVAGNYEELAYSASKAGLVSITQSYARLLAPFGRANAVSPSAIKVGYWLRAPTSETEAMLKKNPLQRFLTPEEVATLVGYLCSPESAMITGQNIQIDGGL